MAFDFDAQTIAEWKELGFYYEKHDYGKQWWLMGSRASLSDFLRFLLNYSNDSSNKEIAEHIHLGPYKYLKIMTWHRPLISEHCIGGSLPDIKVLRTIIEKKLSDTSIGEVFEVGKDYAIEADYVIKFFVMADNFDPSSIEFTR